MNIHEHQAKEILKNFGAPVPNGIVIFNVSEIDKKIKILKTSNFALKAQIHAGGRGKAGGVKIVKNLNELIKESKIMLGRHLITPQTGPSGKEVKRLYIEETSNIKKEFYLSCLIDRSSSKIAFISSKEGGMDIEKIAKTNPEKIITTKLDSSKKLSEQEIISILKPFEFPEKIRSQAFSLIKSIHQVLIKKDANLIEINPLVLTNEDSLLCLDAKISFDDNALYRHPDIVSLKRSKRRRSNRN